MILTADNNESFFKKYILYFLSLGLVGAYFIFQFLSSAPEEVRFRHSLRGDLEKALNDLVKEFNKDASYKIVLEYGGNYSESFPNTFKEENKEKRPHLVMISEYNTLTMQQRKNDYIPLYKLIDVEETQFVPVIKEFYSFGEPDSKHSKLYSLPFNCSTAIAFYNKDMFKKAGLPDKAPETWEELEIYAEKLKAAGYVAFTTAWPAAYLLEHFSVVHNIPYATQKNGFEGNNPQLLLTSEPFVNQLKKFAEWKAKGFYIYAGRMAEQAEEKFIKQECAMLFQGPNRLSFVKDKGFEVGVGPYPYWQKMAPGEPYALNSGGTSIWILAGHSSYEGVKRFLNYLASEQVQQKWHELTGYLPTTIKAYAHTKGTNFYAKNPAAYMAVAQVIERRSQSLPNGIRIPNYGAAREKVIDAIENVLLHEMPVEEALDKAVKEAAVIIEGKK